MFDFLTSAAWVVGVFKVLSWALEHPATGFWLIGGVGILLFLVNVGPLKRINADSLAGKIALSACSFALVVGIGWRVVDGVLEAWHKPAARQTGKQSLQVHPTPAQRGVQSNDFTPNGG